MFILTEEMIAAISSSWDEVRKNPKQSGVDFYFTFFTYFPQYTQFFEDFKSVPLEKIRAHPKLRMHGIRVMYALSSMVDSLDEMEMTSEIMRKTVDNHYPRGLRMRDFENLFSIVPIFLENKAGEKFDSLAKKGWEIVVQTLLSVASDRLGELSAAANHMVN